MQTPWAERYAQRTQRMRSSAVRELLKLTEQPDVISFAGGLPAPETFPVAEFTAAIDRVMASHGARALQYAGQPAKIMIHSDKLQHAGAVQLLELAAKKALSWQVAAVAAALARAAGDPRPGPCQHAKSLDKAMRFAGEEALRYRVIAAREFLEKIGIQP